MFRLETPEKLVDEIGRRVEQGDRDLALAYRGDDGSHAHRRHLHGLAERARTLGEVSDLVQSHINQAAWARQDAEDEARGHPPAPEAAFVDGYRKLCAEHGMEISVDFHGVATAVEYDSCRVPFLFDRDGGDE